LKRIVKARGSLDAQEAAALREAEALRLWRQYGYGSLIEYMEMEMGYTPRLAIERLRVAKAIEELPVIADKLEQGELSFSAARELTRVATTETEQDWLDASDDMNIRQVEALVSGHQPGDKPTDPVDPKLRKRRLRFDDIDAETDALLRQARQILEREHGERLDDNAFLRALARQIVDGGASAERTHAPYQIAVTVCDECKRGWQDGGGITVEMSPPALETALCDAQHIGRVDCAEDPGPEAIDRVDCAEDPGPEAIDRMDCAQDSGPAVVERVERDEARRAGEPVARKRLRDIETSPTLLSPPPPPKRGTQQKRKRARSDIPPALRRQVRARDHGRCRVPWCRSSRNVDQHHLKPISQGGQHTLENILSLCESHHIAHHGGALIIEGPASNPTFTRRAHNRFTTAERVVDTTRTLRELGFDKREVAAAIDKARTHVGTAELSLEQWIKIALGYCPRPITS
jgi:hypothetical protein